MRRLESSWTLWENRVSLTNNPKPNCQYQSSVKKMHHFETLEEFAAYWKHPDTYISSILNFFDCQGIKKFILNGEIVCSNTISMFRDEIRPLWEDPRNVNGGEFFTYVKMEPTDVDKLYSTVLFMLIGNSSPWTAKILGARFHYCKKACNQSILAVKLQLWTSFDSKNTESFDQVRAGIIKLLEENKVTFDGIGFKDHKSATHQPS